MDTRPTDEQPVDFSGRSFGPYLLLRRIGIGGTATVYQAVHQQAGTEVAIKVLHRDSNDTTIRRFNKEIRLGQVLADRHQSRHIAPIVCHGTEGGLRWAAMKLLVGKTVREILLAAPDKGMRWEAAAFILLNVCRAVSTLHDVDIVHRDLKPENLFLSLTPTGQLWVTLLDLGIAKEFNDEPKTQEGLHLTKRNECPGTQCYMAPERIYGASSTPRTDQYSLGVLLYECLHRQLPFPPSAGHTSLIAQSNGSLDRLVWKRVPEQIKHIVLRAMAKDSDERFPSVQVMAQELHTCLEQAREFVDGKSAVMDLLSEPRLIAWGAPDDERTTNATRVDGPPDAPPEATGWADRSPSPEASNGPRDLANDPPSPLLDGTPAQANPSTHPPVDPPPDAQREETQEKRPSGEFLAIYGARIYRLLRASSMASMISLASMAMLIGDPQWTRLRARWTQAPDRVELGESSTLPSPPQPVEPTDPRPEPPPLPQKVPTPAVVKPPAAPTVRPLPADVGTPAPSSPPSASPPTPSPPRVSKSEGTRKSPTEAPGPSASQAGKPAAEPTVPLMPIPKSAASIRKATRLIREICSAKNVDKGKICVELKIGRDGKPTEERVTSSTPAGLTITDPRGLGCAATIARLHVDLKGDEPMPTQWERCFEVVR